MNSPSIQAVFDKFKTLPKVRIAGDVWKVSTNTVETVNCDMLDYVILKKGKRTVILFESDLSDRWAISKDKLCYIPKNLVTGDREQPVNAEIEA